MVLVVAMLLLELVIGMWEPMMKVAAAMTGLTAMGRVGVMVGEVAL